MYTQGMASNTGGSAVTSEELTQLRAMSTTKIRRNYWLCQDQLDIVRPSQRAAIRELMLWQASYLDELVRRGARV